jgi:hypothetical protein
MVIFSLGKLGSFLAEYFSQKNYSIHGGYYNQDPEDLPEKWQPFYFNLAEPNTAQAMVEGSTVIICFPPSIIESIQRWNHFLDHLNNAQSIIHISTTSVFGTQGRVDEQTQPKPDSDRGSFNLKLEQTLINRFANAQIIRSAGQYHLDRKIHPGFSLSGKSSIQGGFLPINLVSYSHIAKCIKFLIDKPTLKLVHACNHFHPLKKDYYTEFCRKRKLDLPHFGPAPGANSQENSKIVHSIYPDMLSTELLP